MGATLIYLGNSRGGLSFASAVFSALGNDKNQLIVSTRLKNIPPNATHASEIPSGMVENLLFFFKFRKRKSIIKKIASQIHFDTIIFLMPHPINFALNKVLKNRNIYTVIHDARPHQGDIWPTRITIRRLAKSPGIKILLSKNVSMHFENDPKIKKIVLPLIMSDPLDKIEKKEKDIDILFLGRHKRYKNYKFQIKLIKKLAPEFVIYVSMPIKYKKLINNLKNVIIQNKELSDSEYPDILARSKCLVLTHRKSSQSGLLVEAVMAGIKIVGPRIPGISEQFRNFQLSSLYQPNNLEDAISKITEELSNEKNTKKIPEIIEKNNNLWRQIFVKNFKSRIEEN